MDTPATDKLDAILVADDDRDVLQAARLALAPLGARVDIGSTLESVERLVAVHAYDCILLDMNFTASARSGDEGLALLETIRRHDRAVAVVFFTAFGGVQLAVETLKRGASDFLLKPWRNEALVATVRAAAARTRSASASRSLGTMERDAIAGALTSHRGNVARAAESLGLSRPALYRRMSKYGL